MSDPLDRLRDFASGPPAPDASAIRGRSRRIQARRYAALGTGAGLAVAVVACAVVLARPEQANRLASGPRASSAAESAVDATAAPAEPAAQSSTGSVTSAPSAPVAKSAPAGGGRSATAAPTSGGTTGGGAAAPAAMQDAARSGLELTLDVSPGTIQPGGSAELALSVCNRTSDAITESFPDGRRYDFEVARGGTVVWRWSSGRAFTQVTGERRWEPGECTKYTQTWNGSDDHGRPVLQGSYDVTGILSSSPARRSAPKAVCVTTCG